jgi:hypothetical protein
MDITRRCSSCFLGERQGIAITAGKKPDGNEMSKARFLDTIRLRENRSVFLVGTFGISLAILHMASRHVASAFSVRNDVLSRPQWITVEVTFEFLVHLIFLGTLIRVTTRSIPAIDRPHYSSDGTESMLHSRPPEPPIRWARIMMAWSYAAAYLIVWSLAYGFV